MAGFVDGEFPMETNPSIRRKYEGPINFFKPTFYISHELGERPAQLVRDLIAGDKRFFEPMDETVEQRETKDESADYNYNANIVLAEAISEGARGAYWDILSQIRVG